MKSKFIVDDRSQGATLILILHIGRENPILDPLEFSDIQQAKAGIAAIREANKADRYFIVDDRKGNFYIEMRDANGALIAISHSYTKRYNAQQGIVALKKYIPMAQSHKVSVEELDV